MKKDKEWLKEAVLKLQSNGNPETNQTEAEREIGRLQKWTWNNCVDRVYELIDQLDEPQKVVVPKWFDEWVKKNILPERRTYSRLYELFSDELAMELTREQNDWIESHIEEAIRAILDGYEVEKEKRYYVDFGKGFYLERGYADRLSDISIYNSTKDWLTGDGKKFSIFTEAEIKSIDERYWAFAVPVEEVNE